MSRRALPAIPSRSRRWASIDDEDVGESLDFSFPPQVVVIAEFQQRLFVGIHFADRVDHQASVRSEILKRLDHWFPDRRGADSRIQVFQRLIRRVPHPRFSHFQGEPSRPFVAGEYRSLTVRIQVPRELNHDVCRAAQTGQAQGLPVSELG